MKVTKVQFIETLMDYIKDTRSWDLMKFKDFHDAEATIIDYQIGKGKRKGTLGKFIMEDEDGIRVRLSTW